MSEQTDEQMDECKQFIPSPKQVDKGHWKAGASVTNAKSLLAKSF